MSITKTTTVIHAWRGEDPAMSIRLEAVDGDEGYFVLAAPSFAMRRGTLADLRDLIDAALTERIARAGGEE